MYLHSRNSCMPCGYVVRHVCDVVLVAVVYTECFPTRVAIIRCLAALSCDHTLLDHVHRICGRSLHLWRCCLGCSCGQLLPSHADSVVVLIYIHSYDYRYMAYIRICHVAIVSACFYASIAPGLFASCRSPFVASHRIGLLFVSTRSTPRWCESSLLILHFKFLSIGIDTGYMGWLIRLRAWIASLCRKQTLCWWLPSNAGGF